MARQHGTTGSLGPAFASARLVGLAVRPASALTLAARFPTVLSRPWGASVTLWEATAPVKLPTCHCPQSGSRTQVRALAQSGWYLTVGSAEASAPTSQPPTYPAQTPPKLHDRLQSRFTGSFRLLAGSQHLHWHYSFTGSLAETAAKSLRHSCRSELTRQGISLP